MANRELHITKRLVQVQGRTKPQCEARAIIPASEAEVLVQHFGNEPLFKRTAYASGFEDGGYQPTPALTKMLANFVRNDACPEVLVKTLINGQRYEANTFWDILCFEFIARVGFDALLIMCDGVRSLDHKIVFVEPQAKAGLIAHTADLEAFEADLAADEAKSLADAA